MTLYAHMPRQTLVDALLAPAAPDERDGSPLLLKRLDIARELLLRDLALQMESGPLLPTPDAVRDWLRLYFLGCEREIFVVLFLDAQHRLLCSREMFQGTIDSAEVHPREVVKEALRCNAASLIVVHNHPSGNAEPSPADRSTTAQLRQALQLVDVRLLDHFIVAGDQIVSLALRDWV